MKYLSTKSAECTRDPIMLEDSKVLGRSKDIEGSKVVLPLLRSPVHCFFSDSRMLFYGSEGGGG